MRISLAVPLAHDLQTITAAVSQPAPATPSTAPLGVIVIMIIMPALPLAAIAGALKALSGLLGQLLALLGTVAIGLAIVVVLAGIVVSNRAEPSQLGPANAPRPTSTAVPIRQSPGAHPRSNRRRTVAPSVNTNWCRNTPSYSNAISTTRSRGPAAKQPIRKWP